MGEREREKTTRTHEIDVQDLVIPPTGDEDDLPLLRVSHADLPRLRPRDQSTHLLKHHHRPPLELRTPHIPPQSPHSNLLHHTWREQPPYLSTHYVRAPRIRRVHVPMQRGVGPGGSEVDEPEVWGGD